MAAERTNSGERQSCVPKVNQLTAHCALWDTCATRGVPVICASNMSISGAALPTKLPSLCLGPGCVSPGQVHRESFCPGRKERIPSCPVSPLTCAAAGRLLMVWFATVPISHVSYV